MALSPKKHELHKMMKHEHQQNDHNRMIPVHISKEEIIGFNILQATENNPDGQWVDPKSGLREYSRLGPIVKQPHIRDMFIELAAGAKGEKDLPGEVKQQMETPLPDDMFIPIPSDNDPEVQKMAHDVTTADDEFMVMMPMDLVHFLSFLQGGENNSPADDLPQFGWNPFKWAGNIGQSIVRVGATIAGTVIGFSMGGPLGAAAGAYLGNSAGRAVTGQSFGGDNSLFKAAIPNAFYGYAAGSGLSAMGYGATAAGTAAGTTATAAPVINGTTGAPHVFTTLGTTAPQATAAAAPGIFSQAGALASKYAVPAGLIGAGYLFGKKGDKQREQKEQEYNNRQDEAMQGMNKNWKEDKLDVPWYHQPRPPQDIHYGLPRERRVYKSLDQFRKEWEDKDYERRAYKKGGIVTKGVALKGPGDGQADKINKKIPQYTWIHDAHTVSGLGNGSSDVGHKEIRQFEGFIKKELLPKYKHKLVDQIQKMPGKRLPKIACAVANDEGETPPLLVGALGKGSFEKGGQVLREMTKEMRTHKSSNGDQLPPASHGLMTYYKRVKGRI